MNMNSIAKEIFPTEAFSKSQQGALFVDVREKHELESEAYDVPNLVHIPLAELALRYKEIPTDKDVVIVCRGGGRSLHALHFLISKGYTKRRQHEARHSGLDARRLPCS